MEGQTVQALIDALKKCDPEKLIIIRGRAYPNDGSRLDILGEPSGVEETPENVYIDFD